MITNTAPPKASPQRRTRPGRGVLAQITRTPYIYLMVLPTVAFVLVFSYLPALIAVYRSFYMMRIPVDDKD